tara:strand:+ start:370 stop:561 length:192 start_codon:yes stop_codon:yes gene_type:complete
MKLVVALVFLFNGEIDHDKTMYFQELNACMYYAQNYSRERSYFEPTESKCKLAWVDRNTKVLK